MGYSLQYSWASLVTGTVKNPAMWETWVQSLGWEDPLEEGLATHSSVLAWRIPMNRGAWWAAAHGVTKSRTQLSSSSQGSECFPILVLLHFVSYHSTLLPVSR